MRKLLVASQKSGVGKTTTAINLAAAAARAAARVLLLDADPMSNVSAALRLGEHPERTRFRQAGLELPGVVVSSVIPGLDVVSPYEEGSCTDEDLDDLLKVIRSPEFDEHYGCLIINAPPFMGANPGQLLAGCSELVIVMASEMMAARTLPAFLELVQRNKSTDRPIRLRGILLTTPEETADGVRWERELRGRFGGRVLANVIPYDEEVGKTQRAGQVLLQAAPDSPAASQFQQLAAALELSDGTSRSASSGREAPLLRLAESMQAAGHFARHSVAVAVAAGGTSAEPPALSDPPPFQPEAPPKPRPSARVPARPKPPARTKAKAKPEGGAAPAKPKPVPAAQPPATERPGGQPWIVWLGLAAAVVIGVGLRLIPKMPDFVMPIVIGILVTAGVLLALRLAGVTAEEKKSARKAAAPGKRPSASQGMRAAPPERKAGSRSHITALARQRRAARFQRDRDQG